jgi:hypothetical protein
MCSMALPNYTPERRREIARLLDVDEQYLYQITKGLKTASPALARKLHGIDPLAALQDLRPDDHLSIWPHLKKRTPARATTAQAAIKAGA